ncbi:MAG: hypothetical protein WBV39_12285 [Rudaea sp.]
MKMRSDWFIGLLVSLAFVCAAGSEHAVAAAPAKREILPGSATGFVKVDGKRFQISHAYALGVVDDYWVLLTDVSVPGATFLNPRKVLGLGQDGKTHGLLMIVDSKGNPNPVTVLQASEMTGDMSWQKTEFSALSKAGMEATTYTLGPHKMGAGSTCEYRVSFKAPVNIMK